VALLSEVTSGPVKTFTIGFNHFPEQDERRYARLVASRYGTDHNEYELPPITASGFEDLVRRHGQPFADSSAYPCYAVSRAARERVTVALSGDGGDEAFGGYDHYRQQLRWIVCDGALAPLARLAGTAGSTVLSRVAGNWRLARVARGFQTMSAPLPARYALQMHCLKPQELNWLYTKEFKAELATVRNGDLASEEMARADGEAPIDYMMRHDQNHYLPDCLMTKTDITSMANSLEVRCPFLDHKLVEFASTIPHAHKYKDRTGKFVLRNIARKFLPEEVVGKKKSGFSIPLQAWLAGPMKSLMMELVSSDAKSLHQLVKTASIQQMITQQVNGEHSWGNRLWALMVLQVWLRQNCF
jgi:asparagine synthase (glutamine-hydrolysing)